MLKPKHSSNGTRVTDTITFTEVFHCSLTLLHIIERLLAFHFKEDLRTGSGCTGPETEPESSRNKALKGGGGGGVRYIFITVGLKHVELYLISLVKPQSATYSSCRNKSEDSVITTVFPFSVFVIPCSCIFIPLCCICMYLLH